MNKELAINPDACYTRAEQQAADYFQSLYNQVEQKSYLTPLTKDMESWKEKHIHHHSLLDFFSRGKKKPKSKNYREYIKWLDYTGKLDDYLDRSISYIYMRDMGKALDAADVQSSVQQTVEGLREQLHDATATSQGAEMDWLGMDRLYRLAQEYHIETTMIWLLGKLKSITPNLPKELDAVSTQRKLLKIIVGVLINELEGIGTEITTEERAQKLDVAIRLGYAYGLTYPFIDDLLDAKVLSVEEEARYSDLIGTTLTTGSVPELGEWAGEHADLIGYVHAELKDAFEYIRDHQPEASRNNFLEQAYVFFRSQEVDRAKELSNGNYTNEELYIPVILKSASSRLIVHTISGAIEDEGLSKRTFYYGIYNQLADDLSDMFSDRDEGAVTPYTYYLAHHEQRPDLINPFELYWTVISNLIHNVYASEAKAREVLLDRAINGLKRLKEKLGTEKYNDVMAVFTAGMPTFNDLIQTFVRKADDVDFIDKLIRDQLILNLEKENAEQAAFSAKIESVRQQINASLLIAKADNVPLLDESIIDAANYSLNSGGKRLRPIVTWMMAVDGYGLKSPAIMPLIKSLEYMHTSSLIFDDLPAQDNAAIRRGVSTVHQAYDTATAELTGLFLSQKAIEEQTKLVAFESETVLRLIQYTAQVTADMCKGQIMDLKARGKQLTLEQLNMICFYKTGIGFEASLVMPAILAHAKEEEMAALKKFSRHFGIAFQIKDDLLDVEGELELIGKATGKDAENNNATFVSILGVAEARKMMWEHYCLAMETLQEVPRNSSFLKHLLNYSIGRDH